MASEKQLVTATFHGAPQRLGFVNMDYFNPEPTSPDASTHNYTGTIGHHYGIFGGLLDTMFSITRFDADVWGQGPADLTITPVGNGGNYFAQKSRSATRVSGRSSYAFRPLALVGAHHFKIGAQVAESSDGGQVSNHPIHILDSSGRRCNGSRFCGRRRSRSPTASTRSSHRITG